MATVAANQDEELITKRLVRRAEETNKIADETLKELEDQKELVKKQQDEVAEIHDTLTVAERKMRGIGSFWGSIVNAFTKADETEARRDRQKYEKDLATEKFQEEEIKNKQTLKDQELALKQHKEDTKLVVADNASALRHAKKDDKVAIKRGETGTGAVISGGFIFEQREIEVECEAEKDMGVLHDHVKDLKTKAEYMGQEIDDSHRRLEDLSVETDRAQQRTQNLNRKAAVVLHGKKGAEKLEKKNTK